MSQTTIYDISDFDVRGFSLDEKKELFSNGSFASHIITRILPKIYTDLRIVDDEQFVTYRNRQNNPYLLRMFTNTGLKFMPSKQLGVGRSFNINETMKKGKDLNLIIVGLQDYPQMWINFVSFNQLIKMYPNAMVPAGHIDFIKSF